MTGDDDRAALWFVIALALLVVVAGSIALPEVWLRSGPAPAPRADLFDPGPSQLREWVCVDDECVMARGSLVMNDDGSVAWVINPDNPLTTLELDDRGREENVRIAAIRAVEGRVHLQLESGRIVTRTREGEWRPGVGEFRESATVSILVAAMTVASVLAIAWLRARRIDVPTLVAAGVAGAVVHLPLTIWEHSTSISLSAAAALATTLVVVAMVVGYLVAGPRHRHIRSRTVGSPA